MSRRVVVFAGSNEEFRDYVWRMEVDEGRSSVVMDRSRGIATSADTTYIRVGWAHSSQRLRGLSGPAELVTGPTWVGPDELLAELREHVKIINQASGAPS